MCADSSPLIEIGSSTLSTPRPRFWWVSPFTRQTPPCGHFLTPILKDVSDTASAASLCVHVRLFASYREAAGTNRLDATIPCGATVARLLELLDPQVPGLSRTRGLVAVNHTYAQPDTTLHDGDEVALIPPVSGGR
jgi:molybdopterin converting factor subunit 1